jgi:hypothetical protein
VSAGPIIGWMCFLSLRQLAVTTYWCGSRVFLLWAFLVQVAGPAPHTPRRLFAVCPDVAILNSVRFYPDCNEADACQSEDLLGFYRSGQGDEEYGRCLVGVSSHTDRRVDVICLTLIMSKSIPISPSEMSSTMVFIGRWRITTLMDFRDLG